MISAVVLAAGESKRMGQPKMILPWAEATVIGKVVKTLIEAGIDQIVVVTGSARNEVEHALDGYSVDIEFNQEYASGEMLKSAQTGIIALGKDIDATLIVLGDQPQIEQTTVTLILERYASTHQKIIVPSYTLHRGHPWLVDRVLWQEILELSSPKSLRDFLDKNKHIPGFHV